MGYSDKFLRTLNISADRKSLSAFAVRSSVSVEMLRYYNDTNTLPSGDDLDRICTAAAITPLELMLGMERLDRRVLRLVGEHANQIHELIQEEVPVSQQAAQSIAPTFQTSLGTLYQADCLNVLRQMEGGSVDLVFADPPFNLDKLYPSGIDDNLKESQYLDWCEEWASECVRVLKPGGSFFVWNLPKWNTSLAEFLNGRLTFRHWIAVDIKYRLPIAGRLYPSHYSLLYYCKGPKPTTFHPDRLPMEVCPSCAEDLRDYGGYKSKMNPAGVNMADVWYDIPPVRHAKYKGREGANELSIKLMDRVIEMASEEGDVIFDPFGGAGTTYVVAEIKSRRWIGAEIGPVDDIVHRFERLDDERCNVERLRRNYNTLFTETTLKIRRARGLWTSDSVRSKPVNGGMEYLFERRGKAAMVDNGGKPRVTRDSSE